MLSLIFALIGLLAAGMINRLADVLPQRRWPATLRQQCPRCQHTHALTAWLAIGRLWRNRGRCPACDLPARSRPLLVEIGTVLLFAALPALIPNRTTLIIHSFYIAVLILIMVIDLEHRLILDVITLPTTVIALIGSLLVVREENTLRLAVAGAVTGFLLFSIIYWIGRLAFGPGAFGAGDVKLALLMGAMLGFHRILFALVLAIMLGGLISLLLLLSRRFNRYSYVPYGQYMVIAAIVMLIWGVQIYNWYGFG